jgi:hypothetical protein
MQQAEGSAPLQHDSSVDAALLVIHPSLAPISLRQSSPTALPIMLSALLFRRSTRRSAQLLHASRPAPSVCSRTFAAQSAAPASRPAVDGAGRPLPAAFARRINTPEQDLQEFYAMQRRNALLGIGLALFVGGIWAYSVHAVTSAKDSFTTPEVQQIQQELDREEAAKGGRK